MLRRLCGGVKCNASPRRTASPRRNSPVRTSINNVKNYLIRFNKNIKVANERGVGSRRRLQVSMYVNGEKAGYAGVEIDPYGYAEFNMGKTYNKFEKRDIGRILRALLTKAVINTGKYNRIIHEGANISRKLKANNTNKRPISTRIMQNKLGYAPNKNKPNKVSIFTKNNNKSRINKTLNNYKKGLIGPKRKNAS